MTLEALNKFTKQTEDSMTDEEFSEWMALTDLERKAAAYAAFIVIHGCK